MTRSMHRIGTYQNAVTFATNVASHTNASQYIFNIEGVYFVSDSVPFVPVATVIESPYAEKAEREVTPSEARYAHIENKIKEVIERVRTKKEFYCIKCSPAIGKQITSNKIAQIDRICRKYNAYFTYSNIEQCFVIMLDEYRGLIVR